MHNDISHELAFLSGRGTVTLYSSVMLDTVYDLTPLSASILHVTNSVESFVLG